jgi:1-phosphofructokinase
MDKTVILDELKIGETNRVKDSRTDPGGKGINVSRVLRTLGQSSLAMGFVSGSVGRFVEASLNELGILDDFIHTPGQTRTNLAITDDKTNSTTVINEKGPETDPQYAYQLKRRLEGHCQPGTWVVCAGSAPPGIDKGIYAELLQLVKKCNAHTVLDADGELLRRGIEAKPYMIKPNRVELEGLVGRPMRGQADILSAAKDLRAKGVSVVLVSMGADGAIIVSDEGAWKSIPPRIEAESTVGAGDSMIAGVIFGLVRHKKFEEALRIGTAAGAATASTRGTQLGKRADIDRLLAQVVVERLEG